MSWIVRSLAEPGNKPEKVPVTALSYSFNRLEETRKPWVIGVSSTFTVSFEQWIKRSRTKNKGVFFNGFGLVVSIEVQLVI